MLNDSCSSISGLCNVIKGFIWNLRTVITYRDIMIRNLN